MNSYSSYFIVSWARERIVVCIGGVTIPWLEQNRLDLGGWAGREGASAPSDFW